MDIKFHCDENKIFSKDRFVRAFIYTEYFISPHTHDFYEMNIVLGGTGIHQIEDNCFSAERGDVFVIPPMVAHAYYNTEQLEVYHVIFKNSFIKENYEEASKMPGYLKLMEIEPFLRERCTEEMFLHLSSAQIAEIQSDLRFIERKSMFDQLNLLPLHKHTTWKLIYHLSYLLEKQNENEKNHTKEKYRYQILDTLEYLSQHYSEKLSINDLATRVYLSRSTFLRSFDAVCGCSPMQYLKRYRVQKAIELSGASTLSKTEIAHSCGFYDLSHMERSLKERAALS